MKRKLVTISAITVMVLSGCSGAPEAMPEPVPTVTVTETAPPEPEPTELDTAPVVDAVAQERWILAAAETLDMMMGGIESWEGCNVDDIAAHDASCKTGLTLFTRGLQRSSAAWGGTQDPLNEGYIQVIPSDLSGLVEEGNTVMAALDEHIELLDANCPDGETCADTLLGSLDSLEDALLHFESWFQ